jgi:type IV secretion system protein TrbL
VRRGTGGRLGAGHASLGRPRNPSGREVLVKRSHALAAVAALAAGLVAVSAHAAPATGLATFPDQVVQQYTTLAAGWVSTFQRYALGTFGLLAVLSIGWSGVKLAFRGAVLEEFLAELVNVIFFVGIGVFVLGNAPSLLQTIINSFRVAGQGAGGVGLAPSQILSAGLTIAGQAWQQLSLWNPGASAGLIIVALVVLLCIAWIAGWMVIALVQVAIYLPVATFFMGFLGSYWTREMAMAVIRQAFALGAKLMMLELLAAAALQFIKNMLGILMDFSGFNAGVVIAASFILALLTKVLPDWLAGVIGGSGIGEGGAIRAAVAGAAAGAAGAALGVAGVAPMAVNAARLAGAQTDAADAKAAGAASEKGESAPEQSRLGRAAALTGGTARNMGSAVASDVGRRLSGQGGRHGLPTWRMSADLGSQTRLMRGDNNTPPPGGGGSGGGAGGAFGGSGGRPEPWMVQAGGFGALSGEHQASAQRSYERWAEEKPELAARHGLEDYVSYVQEKQAERIGQAAPVNAIS